MTGIRVGGTRMEPKRRAHVMVGIFVGLLAFHVWLLYRMVAARNTLLVALLLVAIALFGWRIQHYARLWHGIAVTRPPKARAEEIRQIHLMAPVLAALLVLHAWLITAMLAAGELAFVVVLLLAVVVFVARLGFYAWRWTRLRRAP